MEGAANGAPLAFFARNMVSATEASDVNSSSGNRC